MIPFDPAAGRILAAPPGEGRGAWAGAPGAWREGADLFVSYRLRLPPPLRGYEMRVASVTGDGVEDLWHMRKGDIGAESIERSALVYDGARWRLYVSFVDGRDRRWCIGLVEADTVDGLDASTLRVVLHLDVPGMAAVKDPWLRRTGSGWSMLMSCGRDEPSPGLHATDDALSTGIVRSETGLATSTDGLVWKWEGVVFSPSASGWDRSTARLTTAVRDEGGWTACYDGSASLAENYEERCGIARSRDLRTWRRVGDGPSIETARGAGGVRYVDVTTAGDIFFERTRADGAHELSMISAGRSGSTLNIAPGASISNGSAGVGGAGGSPNGNAGVTGASGSIF